MERRKLKKFIEKLEGIESTTQSILDILNKTWYYLEYFMKGSDLCGNDFERKESIEQIDLKFVESLSELKTFRLPFSNTEKGKYAILTTATKQVYYIKEESYEKVKKALDR